jgi:hypothetical protein
MSSYKINYSTCFPTSLITFITESEPTLPDSNINAFCKVFSLISGASVCCQQFMPMIKIAYIDIKNNKITLSPNKKVVCAHVSLLVVQTTRECFATKLLIVL